MSIAQNTVRSGVPGLNTSVGDSGNVGISTEEVIKVINNIKEEREGFIQKAYGLACTICTIVDESSTKNLDNIRELRKNLKKFISAEEILKEHTRHCIEPVEKQQRSKDPTIIEQLCGQAGIYLSLLGDSNSEKSQLQNSYSELVRLAKKFSEQIDPDKF